MAASSTAPTTRRPHTTPVALLVLTGAVVMT